MSSKRSRNRVTYRPRVLSSPAPARAPFPAQAAGPALAPAPAGAAETPHDDDPLVRLAAVPPEERDVALYRIASRMRRTGVPRYKAAMVIREAAAAFNPPFDHSQAIQILTMVYWWVKQDPARAAAYREAHPEEYLRAAVTKATIASGFGGGHMPVARKRREEAARPFFRNAMMEAGGDELAAGALAGDRRAAPPSLPFLGRSGYIMEEWSHLLAGYPRSGKTELLVRACREWLAAGREVLYLTEEPRSIWQHRLAALGGGDGWKGLQVVFALVTPAEMLFERAMGGEEQVVVIDALRSLLQLEDETDNSRLALALNPWIAAARERHKTLVVAHHMRKGSGEYGEGIAGGHALLGTFDVALELLRDDRNTRRRRIRAYARLLNPPDLLYELGEDGGMRYLGDPSAVGLEEVTERALRVLREAEGEWLKTSEVLEGLGEPRPSASQIRQVLLGLAQQGDIERNPPIAEHAKRRTPRWRGI